MKAGISKDFLQASSPKGLVRKMEKHSRLMGGFIDYQVMESSAGIWFAWFNADIKDKLRLEIEEKDKEAKIKKLGGQRGNES